MGAHAQQQPGSGSGGPRAKVAAQSRSEVGMQRSSLALKVVSGLVTSLALSVALRASLHDDLSC